ncbi:mandelate racemase/muconate lactonizing enzyme family protein [Leifsonia shinshuensis]|uniref:mandelate racemase/muconate lactonizing enzyme family protein n=1 Tax=Leifsonia shinshuensis TaxID=150026 RepID=UPI001F50D41C|nr:mandelate racemase/muconate lactonizing enzyme family protein [Leifsonia shinshuensis]MCI0158755.1 mandelate racemase/muconate lactonizing enzyme family protein [Leifsonia shinshuensis]
MASLAGLVSAVRVDEVVLPLQRPVRNGTAFIAQREYVLVTVETVDGATGTACALTRGAPIRAMVEDFLAPRLIGQSAFNLQNAWQDNYRAGELFLGRSGAFIRALSLIDIALWDLLGAVLERPVAAILGGGGGSAPVMAALGYYQSDADGRIIADLDRLTEEYVGFVERGFRKFKVMAGGAPLTVDVERIRAISSVLPPDAELAVDVNGAWSTAAEGLRFLDAVDVPFSFIEDPFRPDNDSALRRFRAQSSAVVAVGEWESGIHRFRSLLGDGLADVLRIDATACGGIGEWMRIAALASAYDASIVPHYYPEIHVHLAAAVPGVDAVETVPVETGADNFDELLTHSAWAGGASATPLDTPGFGTEWDWERIRHVR